MADAAAASLDQPQTGIAGVLQKLDRFRGLLVPVAFVLLLGVVLVPLPPVILDLLISFNISLAVIILMTTLYMSKPLDFSVFPSLLLATTLLRLVLNIASTRLILTADANSPEEAADVAGKVVSAFGEFVAGGELFVGIIIFAILMIVQFMVITKGAGRISEVTARFTLDAMPGKQMAIDSDLNAGIINEEEAKERRAEIAREADFYGAMDGASKFVKGDVTAGLIITAINILGGFAVGMIQRGWDAGQTAEVFTILTIGDGIASSIPSFIIAIASALVVTQAGQKDELGFELTGQLTSQPKGLIITAGFLAVLAATPLPTVPLLATAIMLGGLGYLGVRTAKRRAAEEAHKDHAEALEQAGPPPVEELLKVDTMELEVGYGLVRLVDKTQGGDLLDRITSVRRQLAVETGLVMPPVRIRDNVQLAPNEYRIKIRGNPVATANVEPDRLLAMDSGIASGDLQGINTTEPAFGLPARWIDPNLRGRAEAQNYTVVEPSSVVATHLTEVTKSFGDELLTRGEVSNLVEQARQTSPKLVEDVVGPIVKLGEIHRVIQNLVRERVSIRDIETILEVLGDWGPKTKDLDVLTEYVRHGLRRAICNQYASPGEAGKDRIVCVTLDPQFEDAVNGYVDRTAAGTTISMPARVSAAMSARVGQELEKVTRTGHPPVVIASPQVRGVVKQMLEPHIPQVAVLGYNEIVNDIEVQSLALVSISDTPQQAEQNTDEPGAHFSRPVGSTAAA
ncbi:MAG: flagellar biosynthesis protein FlhA [Planctomycetota bacterium]